MSRRSRQSHQFAFQRAETLELHNLNFGAYEESIDQLKAETVRAYIMEEAQAVEAERQNDVSDFPTRLACVCFILTNVTFCSAERT